MLFSFGHASITVNEVNATHATTEKRAKRKGGQALNSSLLESLGRQQLALFVVAQAGNVIVPEVLRWLSNAFLDATGQPALAHDLKCIAKRHAPADLGRGLEHIA